MSPAPSSSRWSRRDRERTFNVAAVNPATYRNYTELAVADSQEVWDRIAGGELGLRKKLAKALPQDADQFVKLGGTDDAKSSTSAPYRHRGQGRRRREPDLGHHLGDGRDNALLVRTGLASPQSLQKKSRSPPATRPWRMVDVVALEGWTPTRSRQRSLTGTVADVVGVFRYTVLGGGRIAPTTRGSAAISPSRCRSWARSLATSTSFRTRGRAEGRHRRGLAGQDPPRASTPAATTRASSPARPALQPLLRPGARPQHPRQPARHGRRDGPRRRRDLQVLGLRLGRDWGYTDPMHFEMAELKPPGPVDLTTGLSHIWCCRTGSGAWNENRCSNLRETAACCVDVDPSSATACARSAAADAADVVAETFHRLATTPQCRTARGPVVAYGVARHAGQRATGRSSPCSALGSLLRAEPAVVVLDPRMRWLSAPMRSRAPSGSCPGSTP